MSKESTPPKRPTAPTTPSHHTDEETQGEATKKPTGRPSSYREETAQEICRRLSLGESLASICRDPKMPYQSVVYRWIEIQPGFQEKYTRAREEQAETHADAIIDIADETPETQPVFDREGNVIGLRLDSAYVQWQKNRMDARKWTAAKLKPKKYGDRTTVAGDPEAPLESKSQTAVFTEILAAMKLKRQQEAQK